MAYLPVRVVIVSRERPDALDRCLTGISQLDYPDLEVVVVACPAGMTRIRTRFDARRIKTVPFDAPNISEARNLGIAAAAGEVIAFIDDDAVPEPLWLRHLRPAFNDAEVMAAGGYVVGRNGISLQWGARSVDHGGHTAPIKVADNAITILHPTARRAIKTEGTNMAVRRDVLASFGGFDPAFRFYMDETDLNLRLAREGLATAIAPQARVHHGFAPSIRRRADRTPKDLTEIGASYAVFLRKHCPKNQHGAQIAAFISNQRQRLLRLMQSGQLDPLDVHHLVKGLKSGIAKGNERPLTNQPPLPKPSTGFLLYPTKTGAREILISGRCHQRAALLDKARTILKAGDIPVVLCLSHTALYHHLRYLPEGIWLQTGGLFGRSDRAAPLVQMTRLKPRADAERKRMNQSWNLSPAQ